MSALTTVVICAPPYIRRHIYKAKFLYRLIVGGFISAPPPVIFLRGKIRCVTAVLGLSASAKWGLAWPIIWPKIAAPFYAYDAVPAATDRLDGDDIIIAGTIGNLAANCHLIFLCLPSAKEVN